MTKYYYSIGEVSNLLDVKPHVLRYWESEIPAIRPKKSGHQRRYTLQQIEILKKIKEMLYTERFTIEGARQKIKQDKAVMAEVKADAKMPKNPAKNTPIPNISEDLRALRNTLVQIKQQCNKLLGHK